MTRALLGLCRRLSRGRRPHVAVSGSAAMRSRQVQLGPLHDQFMAVDLTWRDAVRAVCEPVFVSTDVGFQWNDSVVFDREHPALL